MGCSIFFGGGLCSKRNEKFRIENCVTPKSTGAVQMESGKDESKKISNF